MRVVKARYCVLMLSISSEGCTFVVLPFLGTALVFIKGQQHHVQATWICIQLGCIHTVLLGLSLCWVADLDPGCLDEGPQPSHHLVKL